MSTIALKGVYEAWLCKRQLRWRQQSMEGNAKVVGKRVGHALNQHRA